ncbi:gamma-glutamylcyclotransferase family protein [Heyndrickxia camelliae]|uniref:Gamma-glutamylcyclotransferase family protein n=1 Tax=Heyndrickxia camelliae TaxID=1707093 RepID=A0A2N3LFJ1_9BACI|nr:gamma-glutamylcyclotransferase family protein [Heyndrickxia camelliae]PKR83386.1 branched-chain alpha-keto acid dehydrogenase [Heyndrickxia camelliae]
MHKVFVYGTLRKGGANEHYLKGATCISNRCWTYGELHDTGLGYPAIKEHPSTKVFGEIYVVDDDQLKLVDELEDYEEGGENNLYDRIKRTVYTNEGETEVFVYLGKNPLFEKSNLIESGDWMTYLQGE